MLAVHGCVQLRKAEHPTPAWGGVCEERRQVCNDVVQSLSTERPHNARHKQIYLTPPADALIVKSEGQASARAVEHGRGHGTACPRRHEDAGNRNAAIRSMAASRMETTYRARAVPMSRH